MTMHGIQVGIGLKLAIKGADLVMFETPGGPWRPWLGAQGLLLGLSAAVYVLFAVVKFNPARAVGAAPCCADVTVRIPERGEVDGHAFTEQGVVAAADKTPGEIPAAGCGEQTPEIAGGRACGGSSGHRYSVGSDPGGSGVASGAEAQAGTHAHDKNTQGSVVAGPNPDGPKSSTTAAGVRFDGYPVDTATASMAAGVAGVRVNGGAPSSSRCAAYKMGARACDSGSDGGPGEMLLSDQSDAHTSAALPGASCETCAVMCCACSALTCV